MLSPDNIPFVSPKIVISDGVCLGIFNPNELLPIKETSVAMGYLFSAADNWHEPGSALPDGSYAMFRASRQKIELATDFMGSRTIWYAQTPDTFIASTSQRAIVYFLESFEPNEEAFAWMLSAGSLGPGLSWDRRIQYLPLNSRLLLDRDLWRVSLHTGETRFSPENLSKEEHREKLKEEIEKVFQNIHFDPTQWVLPLSGGYDSRMLLLMLYRSHPEIRCVTWGSEEALKSKFNDAFIAKKICVGLGVGHHYFITSISNEPVENIFRRFLINGEGRIDHISAYLDGFELWKILSARGVKGIIRGDECFGSRYLISELDFRKFMFATMLSDYAEFREMTLPDGFRQKWPDSFRPLAHETLEMWRDRLYTEYYFAFCLAPLNDLKLAYVEIMIPFIARSIIERVRKLPDVLRTEKMLFREIVKRYSPPVPFARYAAVDIQRKFLKNGKARELLLDELNSAHNGLVWPKNLREKISQGVHRGNSGAVSHRYPLISRIRPFIPPRMVKTLQKLVPLSERVDYFDLALRSYIISSMSKLLSQDAKASAKADGFPK
jgi:hypothetical protein